MRRSPVLALNVLLKAVRMLEEAVEILVKAVRVIVGRPQDAVPGRKSAFLEAGRVFTEDTKVV